MSRQITIKSREPTNTSHMTMFLLLKSTTYNHVNIKVILKHINTLVFEGYHFCKNILHIYKPQ